MKQRQLTFIGLLMFLQNFFSGPVRKFDGQRHVIIAPIRNLLADKRNVSYMLQGP